MLKNLAFGLATVLCLASCAQNNAPADRAAAGETAAEGGDGKHFGAAITADNAMPYEQLVAQMASTDSMPAKVTAKVGEVCQTKGCWMTLVSDQPGQPEMRVTFLDYGFFVPKDLPGKRVTVEGYALMDETPVDVLRHYAEDAGKDKAEIEAITEPERELTFVATGVVINE